MFDSHDRDVVRALILERAADDVDIEACALIGSAARGEEDAWSDIDVALRLAETANLDHVVTRWTTWMRSVVSVADYLDVHASGALYRVFLLDSALQVDLSFWPSAQFRSTCEAMHVVFGTAGTPETPRAADSLGMARTGWLYALHARSAIARERSWQADMMLAGLRDQVIALACVRLGLNPAQGRGAHRLPADLSAQLLAARASSVDVREQRRSLRDTLNLYRSEVARHDPELASAVGTPLSVFGLE